MMGTKNQGASAGLMSAMVLGAIDGLVGFGDDHWICWRDDDGKSRLVLALY
jgi:hypothetical protein